MSCGLSSIIYVGRVEFNQSSYNAKFGLKISNNGVRTVDHYAAKAVS